MNHRKESGVQCPMACSLLLLSTVSFGGSQQLGSAGAAQIEGSAGAGLVPWSVIAGYGTAEETDVTAYYTQVTGDDFDLKSRGIAIGIKNRVEVSLARQSLDLKTVMTEPRMDTIGLKFRLGGDLIYSDCPQFSIGVHHKDLDESTLPPGSDARDTNGVDFYLSATKLWLAAVDDLNAFASFNLRSTRSNQLGLLGFGGRRDNGRDLVLEGSAGIFLNRRLALGFEYRQKPDNLISFKESDWWDVFIAWFPHRNISLVAAYVDFGDLGGQPNQSGVYLSLQGGF